MSQEMELDTKPNMNKSNRKIAKPIMEKKRRARINASLNELKSLLVEVLQKEGCRHSSKMEKADILEMAVRHLRSLQGQQYQGANVQLRDPFQRTENNEKYSPTYSERIPLTPQTFRPTEVTSETRIKPATSAILQQGYQTGRRSSSPKLDMNKNILPAIPQPVRLNPVSTSTPSLHTQHPPHMTKTANGEIAVVLPQDFLKTSSAVPQSSGYILPIYTMPQSGGTPVKTDQPLMISINLPPQPPMSSVRPLQPAPVSPVWRPW